MTDEHELLREVAKGDFGLAKPEDTEWNLADARAKPGESPVLDQLVALVDAGYVTIGERRREDTGERWTYADITPSGRRRVEAEEQRDE